jgi:expansin (peptidoglycan-binding protein)
LNHELVAAVNRTDLCGAYAVVTGPKGSVTVRIVDLCPGCDPGDIDLSQAAFSRIADLSDGRVAVSWQLGSPKVTGPIAYHFKAGSNPWWTAVQVRNPRHPIAKLEYYANGRWINVPRIDSNYFVKADGMGAGPYSFRVTDRHGQVLIDQGIMLVENGTVKGKNQFPPRP